jgi:hypothetical protein
MALGTDEQLGETVDARLFGAEASQCVLVHLVFATAGAQLTTQGRELADTHAAVLGDDRRVGCCELGGNLVDHGDFLGTGVLSCHVHLLSLLLGCSLCSEHRRSE